MAILSFGIKYVTLSHLRLCGLQTSTSIRMKVNGGNESQQVSQLPSTLYIPR